MKQYKVTITETLETEVEIEAVSKGEAERIAQDKWKNGEYILDAESFQNVAFKARQCKEHEYEL